MADAPLPEVRSFLLADQVFQQVGGKWCLIGVFNSVFAPQFPILRQSIGLFVVLSDAEGRYRVEVEFRDSLDRTLAVLRHEELEVESRLDDYHLGLQTTGLPLFAPGRYFFKLKFNGHVVKDIPLDVVEIDPPEGEPI